MNIEEPELTGEIFKEWNSRIPQDVEFEIRNSFQEAKSGIIEFGKAISTEYPGLAYEIQQVLNPIDEILYKIGIISFALGYINRNGIWDKLNLAKSVSELPDEVKLILYQSMDPIGEMIGEIYDLVRRHKFSILPSWKQKSHVGFERLQIAELDCLMYGIDTLIID